MISRKLKSLLTDRPLNRCPHLVNAPLVGEIRNLLIFPSPTSREDYTSCQHIEQSFAPLDASSIVGVSVSTWGNDTARHRSDNCRSDNAFFIARAAIGYMELPEPSSEWKIKMKLSREKG